MDTNELKRQQVTQNLGDMLTKFIKVLGQYFKSMDIQAVTIILGVATAHQIPGEMVWVRLYGGSRSGKTELLRSIAAHPDSTQMEFITPASIRGGLSKGSRLLNRINGKLVITKDFAALLTSKREARNEVFGLMRNVKDGVLIADFGTEDGYTPQKSKFDWIVATTPVFAQYKQMEDLLGARYVDLEWRTGDREEMAHKAMENNPILDTEIRPRIAAAVCEIIDAAKQGYPLLAGSNLLDEESKKLIAGWADLAALLRTPVARDRQHNVRFRPSPEVGTDLAQGLRRIAEGLTLLGVDDLAPHIARLCQDSIPFDRKEVIATARREGRVTPGFKHSPYVVDDLRLLKVLDDSSYLNPQLRERIDRLFSYFT